MQCSNCGSAMIQSKAGWLCLHCGHTEVAGSAAAPTQPEATPPPEGPELPGAPSPHVSDESEHDGTRLPVATPIPSAGPPPAQPTMPGASPVMPDPTPTPSAPAGPSPASSVMPGLPPAVPERSGGFRPKHIVAIVATLIAIVVIVGIAIWKLFWYDPYNAPIAYLNKLAAAKTGNFKASLTFTSSGSNDLGLDRVTLDAAGDYDVTKPSDAKLDTTLGLRTGDAANESISAHIISVPKTTYFQVTTAGLLSFLGINSGQTWYSIPTQQSADSTKCTTSTKQVGNIDGFLLPTQVPVKDAHRVGWTTSIAGHTTTHYVGTIDFDKLQTVVDDANKGLSADCRIAFNKNDYKGITVSYDLWTSSQFDRLGLTIKSTGNAAEGTAVATVDSSGYNQPVSIKAPAHSQPFDTSSLGIDASGSGSVDNTTPTAPSNPQALSPFLRLASRTNQYSLAAARRPVPKP